MIDFVNLVKTPAAGGSLALPPAGAAVIAGLTAVFDVTAVFDLGFCCYFYNITAALEIGPSFLIRGAGVN